MNVNKKESIFFRRAFIMMIVAIFAFTGLFVTTGMASAAVTWGESTATGYNWGKGSEDIFILKVNGTHAFCLEPDQMITTVKGYKEKSSDFTKAQWEQLVKIAHFGYNKGKKTKEDYAATQIILWEQIYKWKGITPQSLSKSNVPNIVAKKKAINNAIKNYDAMLSAKPAFSGEAVKATSGKTIKARDTKSVLGKYDYYVASTPSGVSASINKNKHELNVTAVKGSELSGNIILKIKQDNLISGNKFYYHSSSQNVANIGYMDDLQLSIPLTVNNKGDLKLIKKSKTGKIVTGAEFEVTSSDNSFKKTYTTGEDGTFLAENLIEGKYKVREINVPKPYILDNQVQQVVVKAGEVADVEFTNDMPKGIFILKKTDEYGVPLAGAEFRIYSEGSDDEGNEIGYNERLVTDENGQIEVRDLKLGKYFYQETKAPEGYLLDDKIYEFKIEYKDNVSPLVEVQSETVNYEPRGSIKLTKGYANLKTATENEKKSATLEGAVYELYAKEDIVSKSKAKYFYKKDEKIAELVTDGSGNSNIVSDLPLGKYYIKEIKAPKGCELDKTVHEVEILYKDENTKDVDVSIDVTDDISKIPVIRTSDSFPIVAIVTFAIVGFFGSIFTSVRLKKNRGEKL